MGDKFNANIAAKIRVSFQMIVYEKSISRKKLFEFRYELDFVDAHQGTHYSGIHRLIKLII